MSNVQISTYNYVNVSDQLSGYFKLEDFNCVNMLANYLYRFHFRIFKDSEMNNQL